VSSTRLTLDDVADHVAAHCFREAPTGLVGAELEFLVLDPARPGRLVPLPLLRDLVEPLGPLPGGSRVSYEPGGQVELSSPPLPGPLACTAALSADVDVVAGALGEAGLALAGIGADPLRPPRRQLTSPRYAAMEAFFDADTGTDARWARTMMCSTAALQVCLDAGEDAGDVARRWSLVHALAPVLVAAFANSPLLGGRPTGWRSTRQAAWRGIDASRTRAPEPGGPLSSYTRYALDARVMLLRDDTGGAHRPTPGLRFREWLTDGCDSRPGPRHPGENDLAYHLTTLFPPVRAQGWLELRMIDAQSPATWPVVVAVVSALVEDPKAADAARAACEPVAGRHEEAARDALTSPALRRAAAECFAAALDALPRLGVSGDLLRQVGGYADTHVAAGRCPADDLLEAAERGEGALVRAALGSGLPSPRAVTGGGARA
jgi:glutamate--cysteine ligase